MAVHTNTQKMAQAAYERIHQRRPNDEFASFARSFPSLVHTCGLAQAAAFANAKGRTDYIEDLIGVLTAIGQTDATSATEFARVTREHTTVAYVRLSRSALRAAGWLKRYVEAVGQG
jgi:CRISPR-associated protein Cmr5